MPESQNVDGIVKQLTDSFVSYGTGFVEALPTLLIALALLVAFIFIAGIGRNLTETLSERITDDKNLQSLFGTMAWVLILVIGIFASAGVLFPGLNAGDLVGVLGLSSVAIGFAFKDIFQNFLAGILILAQRPFQINDQIQCVDYEGTVEDITIRSTFIRTHDGERVLIPNSTIYNSPITVQTAFAQRRTVFGTGIGYDEDIEEAREVILDALGNCDKVVEEPAPQVFVASHGDSSVNFDCRYWTPSRTSDVSAAKNEVATAVKYALDEADIEIPYPHRTVEFFDMDDPEDAQTEGDQTGDPQNESAQSA